MILPDRQRATGESPSSSESQLSTKSISSNWREMTAIAALVVAICGLAGSLFSQLPGGYPIAFGLLGIASVLHWKLAKHWTEQDHLVQSIQGLRNANTELQRSEQNLNDSLNQLREEQAALTRTIERMQREHQSIQQTHQRMETTNQNLQTMNQQLIHSLQDLREEKEALISQNRLLENHLHALQEELGLVQSYYRQISQEMEEMKARTDHIDQINDRIAQNNQNMGTRVEELNRFVKLQQSQNKSTTEQWSEQSASLASTIQRLSQQVDHLQQLQSSLEKDAVESDSSSNNSNETDH